MSPPPPFGNSKEFKDLQLLEAITIVTFICGVPAVVLAAGATVYAYHYLVKEVYKCIYNHDRLPSWENGKKVIFVLTYTVGILMTIITWVAVIIVITTIIIAGVMLFSTALILCLIPFVIGGLPYFWYINSTQRPIQVSRPPATSTGLPMEPLLNGNHDNNQPEQNWCERIASVVIKPFFSSVTMRFDSDEESGQKVEVLFAERKDPEDKQWKWWVRVYFLTVFFLAIFWFLAIFIDNLWYRKVTTCNDINVLSKNYICYQINTNGEVKDNQARCIHDNGTVISNPGNVLCYILIYSPGMALGIAVGVARFILFVTDLAFNSALWLGDREWGRVLLVTVQLLASVGSLAFLIGIPVAQVDQGEDINFFKWFLHGRIVGRVFIFALTSITIAVVPLVPWWAFQGAPEYKDISKKN